MTKKNYYKKIAFIGLGLIGGSIACLIREKQPEIQLFAVSRTPATIDLAKKQNIIDNGWNEIEELPKDIDLVFVCTPIELIVSTVRQISNHITNKNLVITDVGSIKKDIADQISNLSTNHIFIPGHPMAGSEKTGLAYADAKIMKNATYILVPNKDPRYQIFVDFLQDILEFRVLELGLEEHDRIVALASHLPYLMAALTVSPSIALPEKELALFKQVISSGFRDTTRVAESAPEWGEEVCVHNSENLLKAVNLLKENLFKLEKLLENKDKQGLLDFFRRIKEHRRFLI